jgi:hypothetical protein
MNQSHTTTDGELPARQSRVRFEVIFASVWFGIGLFVIPALIYTIGAMLLGPYGTDAGLAAFYGDFFADLAEPSARAWAIALGPLLIISVLRAVFLNFKGAAELEDEDNDAPPASRQARRDAEQRVGAAKRPPAANPKESNRRVEPRVEGG